MAATTPTFCGVAVPGDRGGPEEACGERLPCKAHPVAEQRVAWLDGGRFFCDAHRSGIPYFFASADAKCSGCSGDAPESHLVRERTREEAEHE